MQDRQGNAEMRLTLQGGGLSLSRFTSTLKSAAIQESQQNTVGEFLHVFIRKTGSAELGEMVALDHVASSRIGRARCEHNISILIDTHASTFPEKGIWELDVDLADLNGFRQALVRG